MGQSRSRRQDDGTLCNANDTFKSFLIREIKKRRGPSRSQLADCAMFPPMGRLAETAASSRAVWQTRNRNNISLWRRILSSLLLFQPVYNVYTRTCIHIETGSFSQISTVLRTVFQLFESFGLYCYSIHMYTVRFNFLNAFLFFSVLFHF